MLYYYYVNIIILLRKNTPEQKYNIEKGVEDDKLMYKTACVLKLVSYCDS